MRNIHIFLASSKELLRERIKIKAFASTLNEFLIPLDILVSVVAWEEMDSHLTHHGSQKEYDSRLVQCDVFLVLYGMVRGEFTLHETQCALQKFQQFGYPKLCCLFDLRKTNIEVIDEIRLTLGKDYTYNEFSNDIQLYTQIIKVLKPLINRDSLLITEDSKFIRVMGNNILKL